MDIHANRASLLWQAGSDLTFQLSAEHQKFDNEGWDYYSINTNLGNSGNPFDRKIQLDTENEENMEHILTKLDIKKLLSEKVYLKSLTGYRDFSSVFLPMGMACPFLLLIFDKMKIPIILPRS